MPVVTQSLRSPTAPATVALVAAVVLAEFAIIAAFLLVTPLACVPAGLEATCGLLSWAVASGAAVVAFGALYLMARLRLRPGARRPEDAKVPLLPGLGWPLWPAVQVTGFLLVLLPLLVIGPDIDRLIRFGPLPWIVGSLMAAVGALLWLMPWQGWRALLRDDPVTPVLVVVAGLAAPTIFALADRAWEWSPLSRLTFRGVAALAQLFGTTDTDPARYLITLDYFTVEIGAACSGIQGFALILALMAMYFWIDRANLDFRRAWLLVPVALVLSFALNVVRITLLLVIGARYSPELAVDGFHGHAGWLMFVVLGLPLVGVARAVPWFHAAPAAEARRAAPPPLVQDE
ncbi:MAG TPA: exosortase E/protease, VPEID-CTERM system, partial [Amaricoccus sp.]|nr:exosortase E/protease, VPEID-CTERM system [Amaricoccus sp.]